MRNQTQEYAAAPDELSRERGNSRYFRLQYLRAIAAFSVVLFHAAYYLNFSRGDDRLLAIVPPNSAASASVFSS